MSEKTTYKCDVCKKAINTEHALYYMSTVVIHWRDRDTGGETNEHVDTYHVHHDFTNKCIHKLLEILGKKT